MLSATKRFFLLFSVLVSTACTMVYEQTETRDTIRVLIIDGQNNHTVWPKSTVMMKTYLEQTGLFTVDVYRTNPVWRAHEHPAFLAYCNHREHFAVDKPVTDPTFNPTFENYDVVVSNFGYNAAYWPEATQQSFEAYMAGGGAFVAVHAANNAFPDWQAYNEIVGLSGWGGRNENHGPYVYFDEQGNEIRDTGQGNAGAHGTKHEFQITARTPHPITQGMPTTWMHTKDECYGNLRGPAENLTIIASALCPLEEKGTGKHEPMLMTVTYGKGRIFHTTLGHQQVSFESVGFITTFLRGTEWAATGEVTIPIPSDFPTEVQSTHRPFEFSF